MAPSTVLVPLGSGSTPMEELVMVCNVIYSILSLLFDFSFNSFQISMNVMSTPLVVHRYVTIYMAVISVLVILDLHWTQTNTDALVWDGK